MRCEHEAVVGAAPEVVYALVADVARRPGWLRELDGIDPATPTAVEGLRFEGVSKVFGHAFPGASVVVQADPGRVLAERVHIGARFTSEWTFEPAPGGGTRVRHTMEVELPGGPLRLLERLVLARRVRAIQREGLARLATEAVAS